MGLFFKDRLKVHWPTHLFKVQFRWNWVNNVQWSCYNICYILKSAPQTIETVLKILHHECQICLYFVKSVDWLVFRYYIRVRGISPGTYISVDSGVSMKISPVKKLGSTSLNEFFQQRVVLLVNNLLWNKTMTSLTSHYE